MAARLNLRHQDMVREKIRSTQLVKCLQKHVFEGPTLEKSQVTAALGLLKKCLPDLQSTALTDAEGGTLQVTIKHYGSTEPLGSPSLPDEGLAGTREGS